MKLLIVTQVIDTDHPILGFFHRWVEEFAKHCESVQVICLYEGEHDLPDNVTVYSLGKEKLETTVVETAGPALKRSEATGKAGTGVSFTRTLAIRIRYTLRFWKLIWQLRHEYDSVFVHMNQIYVILGAPFWRAAGKKIGLWYAHGAVTKSLHLATFFSHTVFTSTEQGMRIDTPKRQIVGQGIDINHFCLAQKTPSTKLRLVTVGRISKSKNIDTLIKACAELKKQRVSFAFRIIGLATDAAEEQYEVRMKEMVKELGLAEEVVWVGPVLPANLPRELQLADVFIHDGATNSLDKALLEAVLCGCVVVSSNPSYYGLMKSLTPQYLYQPNDVSTLAKIVSAVSSESELNRQQSMQPSYQFVFDSYSITNLISGIVEKY